MNGKSNSSDGFVANNIGEITQVDLSHNKNYALCDGSSIEYSDSPELYDMFKVKSTFPPTQYNEMNISQGSPYSLSSITYYNNSYTFMWDNTLLYSMKDINSKTYTLRNSADLYLGLGGNYDICPFKNKLFIITRGSSSIYTNIYSTGVNNYKPRLLIEDIHVNYHLGLFGDDDFIFLLGWNTFFVSNNGTTFVEIANNNYFTNFCKIGDYYIFPIWGGLDEKNGLLAATKDDINNKKLKFILDANNISGSVNINDIRGGQIANMGNRAVWAVNPTATSNNTYLLVAEIDGENAKWISNSVSQYQIKNGNSSKEPREIICIGDTFYINQYSYQAITFDKNFKIIDDNYDNFKTKHLMRYINGYFMYYESGEGSSSYKNMLYYTPMGANLPYYSVPAWIKVK